MPTDEHSRAEFLRSLLNQQRNINANGGALLNPSIQNPLGDAAVLDTSFQGGSINPDVLSYKPEEEVEQKNGFEKAIDKIFGFADEIAAQFGAGFVGAWEGILDLAATGLGALGDATGWYSSDPFTAWAKKDLGGEAAQYVKTYLTPWNDVRNMFNGNYWTGEYWRGRGEGLLNVATLGNAFGDKEGFNADHASYYGFNDNLETGVGQFLGGAAHSIGFMLPSIMTGGAAAAAGASNVGVQAASLASLGLSAAGKGGEEALNEGASAAQALGYGAASGAVEVASEILVGKALGLVGLGTGKVMGVVGRGAVAKTAKVGSKTFIKELGKTMFEEGMEEVFSAVLEPVTKAIYKGEDAFKDSKGKNIYGSSEFWIGSDGHFLESVAGQFASGAFVGGLSGGIQQGSVYKRVGSDGYQTVSALGELVEADEKLAKLERKGITEGAKYEKLVEERAEAMSGFIEAESRFLETATESQKKALAKMLTNPNNIGEFAKALESDDVNHAVGEFIESHRKGMETHEKARVSSFLAEMQRKYGTEAKLEFRKIKGKKYAFYNADTNTIVVNENTLSTRGGRAIVHEYFGHALADSMSAGTRAMFYTKIVEADPALARRVERAYEREYKGDKAKIREEVIANYLEEVFSEGNVEQQMGKARKIFGDISLFERVLQAFDKTGKTQSGRIAKEYGKVLKQFVRKSGNKTLLKAAAKKVLGVELEGAEKTAATKYASVFDTLVESMTPREARGMFASKDLVENWWDVKNAVKENIDEMREYVERTVGIQPTPDAIVKEANRLLDGDTIALSVLGKNIYGVYVSPFLNWANWLSDRHPFNEHYSTFFSANALENDVKEYVTYALAARLAGFDDVTLAELQGLDAREIGNIEYARRLLGSLDDGDNGQANMPKGHKTNVVDSQGNSLTEEQVKFFENSKVRDENGNLLVVFHGTQNTNDFYIFNKYKAGSATSSNEKLFFFTQDEYVADLFSYETRPAKYAGFEYSKRTGRKGSVRAFYLKMENPFDFRNLSNEQLSLLAKEDKTDIDEVLYYYRQFKEHRNFQTFKAMFLKPHIAKAIHDAGYDGIICDMYQRNEYAIKMYAEDPEFYPYAGHEDAVEYAVFEPNQIKLTTNETPTSDDDIRFSKDLEKFDYEKHPEKDPAGFVKTSDGAKIGLSDHLPDAIQDMVYVGENTEEFMAGVTDDSDGYLSKRIVTRMNTNAERIRSAIEDKFGDDFSDVETWMEEHDYSEEELSALTQWVKDNVSEGDIESLQNIIDAIDNGEYPNDEAPDYDEIQSLVDLLTTLNEEVPSWEQSWAEYKKEHPELSEKSETETPAEEKAEPAEETPAVAEEPATKEETKPELPKGEGKVALFHKSGTDEIEHRFYKADDTVNVIRGSIVADGMVLDAVYDGATANLDTYSKRAKETPDAYLLEISKIGTVEEPVTKEVPPAPNADGLLADEDGNPIDYYFGSPDRKLRRSRFFKPMPGVFGLGYYGSDTDDYAKSVASDRGAIIKAKVRMRNPLVFDDLKAFDKFAKPYYRKLRKLYGERWDVDHPDGFIKMLKDEGYNGIILMNSDGAPEFKGGKVVMPFVRYYIKDNGVGVSTADKASFEPISVPSSPEKVEPAPVTAAATEEEAKPAPAEKPSKAPATKEAKPAATPKPKPAKPAPAPKAPKPAKAPKVATTSTSAPPMPTPPKPKATTAPKKQYFKSIETTRDIVVQTATLIEDYLNSRSLVDIKDFRVVFPASFRATSGKIFNAINDVKDVAKETKRLLDILGETYIEERMDDGTYAEYGVLTDLMTPGEFAALQPLVEDIIKSAPDTEARSRATRSFEMQLNRALDKTKDLKNRIVRTRVLTNQRNAIRKLVDRYTEVTDNLRAREGLYTLLQPFGELHGAASDGYSRRGFRANLLSALAWYTEENLLSNEEFNGIPFDAEVRQALIDVYESLPESERGSLSTETMWLSSRAINLIRKLIRKMHSDYVKVIRPAIDQSYKAIKRSNYGVRKNVIAKLYRMYKRGFAPAYIILNQALGENSVLAKTLTFDMQKALNSAQLMRGLFADKIKKKMKELGLKRKFDKVRFTINGHDLSADQAMFLYNALRTQANYDAINEAGITFRDKNNNLVPVSEKGNAAALLDEVTKALPHEYKALADFIKSELNGSIKELYQKMYEERYGKYEHRNEIGEVGDDSYWMLFRSYERMNNTEKAVSNPAGMFTHAKNRVKNENAVRIGGALSAFDSYVDQLARELYVKPVYRNALSIMNSKGSEGQNIMLLLEQRIDHQDVQYIKNTLDDILGASKFNKGNDVFSKAMSTFTMAKLSMNIGTMLKQFASIWTSNIPMSKSAKAFFAQIFNRSAIKTEYKELVDELGGLKYRESGNGILLANADSVWNTTEKIAQVGMIGISKVDLFTVSTGVVSLMYIAQDQFGYKIGTPENKAWVKEHWSEFELSQIGSGALSKNAIHRGDYHQLVKFVFGFLQGANRAALGSQLNKIGLWNRNHKVSKDALQLAYDEAVEARDMAREDYEEDPADKDAYDAYIAAETAVLDAEAKLHDYERFETAGGNKIPLNMAAGLIAQGVFVAFINQLMKYLKGKKEKEEPFADGEYALSTALAIFMDWVPFVNQIANMVKGYEITVPAVEVLNEIVDVCGSIREGNLSDALRQMGLLLGDATGIPFKTLYEYMYGMTKAFDPTLAYSLNSVLYGASSKSAQISYEKLLDKGDTANAKKMLSLIFSKYKTGYISDDTARRIVQLEANGFDVMPNDYMTSYSNGNGETVDLTNAQIQAFRSRYGEAERGLRDLMSVSDFQTATQAEQASLIKKVYASYYAYAKASVTGVADSKLGALLAGTNGNIGVGKFISALGKIKTIEANKTKSRKELVFDYVNSSRVLSKQEKLLALYLAGYVLNDANKSSLKAYLASKGMSSKAISSFLGE